MDGLCWEASYAVARRLMDEHPEANLTDVTLGMIYEWVTSLPDFEDNPELANDEILSAIYQEWYEEQNPL